jgi:hypothetical protein
MSVATDKVKLTKGKLMNKMTEWNVGGYLMNGDKFAVVVTAPYGYRAMVEAEKVVGKIKAGSAVRKVAK